MNAKYTKTSENSTKKAPATKNSRGLEGETPNYNQQSTSYLKLGYKLCVIHAFIPTTDHRALFKN